jgi:hypothetical protein
MQELRQARVDGSRTLLDTLEAQKRIGFQDTVKWDKILVYFDTSPISIWKNDT